MRYGLGTLLGIVIGSGLVIGVNFETIQMSYCSEGSWSGESSRSRSWIRREIGWPWGWLAVETDRYTAGQFGRVFVMSWSGFCGSLVVSLLVIVLSAFLSKKVCGMLSKRLRVVDQRPPPPMMDRQ